MNLRIAMLTTFYAPPHAFGGVSTVTIELRRRLEQRGCQVDVFVPAFRSLARFDQASTAQRVTRLRCPKWPLLYNFTFARQARPLIAAGGYDIVLNLQSLLGWKLDLHPHIAVVPTTAIGEAASMRVTGPLKLLNYLARKTLGYRCEKKVFARVDRIVAVGDHIADEIHRHYGVPRDKMVSIGNGVDCDRYAPPPQPPTGTPVILYVGRLVSRKNVELLIRAAGVLASRGADFRLELAGEGDRRAALEALSQELNLGSRVRFLGRLDRDALIDVYHRGSVFAMPSRYEGVPMVLLEAQSCGLPAVVGDFAGADQMVRHGQTGFILRDRTPEELAGCLAQLLDDPGRAADMGRAGRQHMIDTFSWDRVIDQYIELMSELVSSGARRTGDTRKDGN